MTQQFPASLPARGRPELRVVAVLATYRDRSAMLEAVLERLQGEGVAQAVVIDNGADWGARGPIADALAARFGDFVDVVAMGGNRGCALGYAQGMERAIALDAELIWLLDDDNRPSIGSLDALLAAWRAEQAPERGGIGPDRLVVSAVRDEHHADVLAGVPERHLKTRWNSFGGFHVRDLAYKLWRRTRLGRPSGHPPATARVDVTPYGGSLFGRALVERFGLPLRDFYQYGDDTEFMWRVTRAGGRILVVTAARIEDLEVSWNPTVQLANRFSGLVAGSSAFRTYYSTRNAAYFESRFRSRNRAMFALNRLIYMGLIRHYARRSGHPERYQLIREGVADGLAGRLSINPRFQLP
jgi:GT2 family glycosyltransferase